jgi:polyhydroxyalkanoate synthesis regulator phasin
MTRPFTQGGDQDEALQELMNDIVRGVKVKLVEPVISESRKLAGILGENHSQDQKELAEIQSRLDRLEEAVRATPLVLLAAIKEAINQAGVD